MEYSERSRNPPPNVAVTGSGSAVEDDEDLCVYGAVGDTTPLEHGLACVFEAPQSGDCPENRFGVFLECSGPMMGVIDDRYGLTRECLGDFLCRRLFTTGTGSRFCRRSL